MAIQSFSSGQTLTAAQMNSLQTNDYNQTVSAKTTSYALVAGDVGTHVQMTAATATTFSVPAATFAAGDSLFLSSQGAGAVTIQAASTAITVQGLDLVLEQYQGGTLRFQSATAATFFPSAPTPPTATSGLVCVKAETAATSATSVTADNIFTSTYTNYLMLVNFTTSADQLCIRLRAGGVSTATGYNTQQLLVDDTTVTSSRVTSQVNIRIQQSVGAESSTLIHIFNPQLAIPTRLTMHTALNLANYTTGLNLNMRSSNQSGSTAFDGIELLALTGTWTGNYAIYGYSKTV